ncbi:chorismate mutase [Rhodococcus sp. MEB064]|uniref:chorismate mutase n=1 Tax=Rhodococcus sp. MEB064 TaxID=1587522 RepID=UPI0005AC5D3D|nr:chorismate mutase [Rhodococcus sp. MEB064]KIQ17573.1 hypothetical protein RU01_10510 [Rhodococcus sp. MEB064]
MSASIDFAAASFTRTDDVDVTAAEHEIDAMHDEIERLDATILAAVERRNEVARTVGLAQAAQGRSASNVREMSALQRFGDLGQEGRTLGMLLLRMGRGRMAH